MSSHAYVLTIYNFDLLSKLQHSCIKYSAYGDEVCPTTKREHKQAFIYFHDKVRPSFVRKMFPNTHNEIMRGNFTQNAGYCSKEGKLIEYGIKPLTQAEKGDAGKRTYDDAFKAAQEGRFDDIPSTMRTRYYNTYKQVRSDYLASIHPEVVGFYAGAELPPAGSLSMRAWQKEINDILQQEPDPRKIIIVHDPKGNGGKTTFAEWLEFTYNGQVFESGDPKDLAYILDQTKTLFMFDFARATTQFPWTFIEAVKNGRVTSTKYQPVQKRFKKPHIIIFCNSFSNDQLSEDRFHIINI